MGKGKGERATGKVASGVWEGGRMLDAKMGVCCQAGLRRGWNSYDKSCYCSGLLLLSWGSLLSRKIGDEGQIWEEKG